jgi:hypothetical protein
MISRGAADSKRVAYLSYDTYFGDSPRERKLKHSEFIDPAALEESPLEGIAVHSDQLILR